jgi:hypothetical protein
VAAANNVELASTPTNASWLNRIEAQFQTQRDFTLAGTDHASHHQHASMIRRSIAWRNRNTHDAGPHHRRPGKGCLTSTSLWSSNPSTGGCGFNGRT